MYLPQMLKAFCCCRTFLLSKLNASIHHTVDRLAREYQFAFVVPDPFSCLDLSKRGVLVVCHERQRRLSS